VCGFGFAQTYGDRGKGFIECRQIVPLHVGGPGRRKLRSFPIALICSVSVLVSFASVQARSQTSELGHVSQITDGAGLP
jgi:hypothetical protein